MPRGSLSRWVVRLFQAHPTSIPHEQVKANSFLSRSETHSKFTLIGSVSGGCQELESSAKIRSGNRFFCTATISSSTSDDGASCLSRSTNPRVSPFANEAYTSVSRVIKLSLAETSCFAISAPFFFVAAITFHPRQRHQRLAPIGHCRSNQP